MISKFIKPAMDGKAWSVRLAFFLCFGLLLIRAGARVTHAELWAEDGNIFLNEVLQFGWRSIPLPHASYYHLLQRSILSAIYYFLPVSVIPSALAFVCLLIAAFVMSRWVSDGYHWLLPEPLYRWGLCMLLCLGPGLGEMLGNLCNLNWFFTLWLAQLCLRDPALPIKKWEMCVAPIALFSTGTAILILPLAIWRFQKNKKTLVLILGLFAVYVLALVWARDLQRTGTPSIETVEWLRTYWRQFRISVLLQPILGDELTTQLSLGKGVRYGGTVSFFLIFLTMPWVIQNRRDKPVQASFIFLLSFSTWVFLVWIGRTGSIATFHQPLGPWFFENRYSFGMSWGAFLFWLIFLEASTHRRALLKFKPFAIVVVVAWTAYTSSYRFFIPAYSREAAWKGLSPTLRASLLSGCPTQVRVRVFPGDAFNFTYKSDKTCHHAN